ncbi:MAG: flagellar assembly protein FliW [Vicinamibacterales bacterium]|nr:flagellar assembly protein FliW [Vicinamibacterales bacterium]
MKTAEMIADAPLTPGNEIGRLRVQTRFGEFEADPRNVLHFPVGMPGFEQCRRFVVLSSMTMAPVQCLHAVDGPAASFLVVDPRLVLPDYRCILSGPDRERLGVTDDMPLLWLAIVTVQEDQRTSVNLRAPIVINPARMLGFQVVPYDSLYPVKFPL